MWCLEIHYHMSFGAVVGFFGLFDSHQNAVVEDKYVIDRRFVGRPNIVPNLLLIEVLLLQVIGRVFSCTLFIGLTADLYHLLLGHAQRYLARQNSPRLARREYR